MGRTGRKRKKKYRNGISLDHEESTINLLKFMKQHGWCNETKLKLFNFKETGRGVSSQKSFNPNDTLITIPYKLMITWTTIEAMNLPLLFVQSNNKLRIHDYLTIFLLVECNKGKTSEWFEYILSLPKEAPPLPWLLPLEQIKLLPSDLQLNVLKSRNIFEESWRRVKKSIVSLDCVLDLNRFSWAYAMVNTRAVYVDPQIIRKMSDGTIDNKLSDEPSMALCPYLDMFNHSYQVNTEAQLFYENEQLFYRLITANLTKKFKQIFISYGSHNNEKLLNEYGFFIPGNICDTIQLKFQEILRIIDLNLDQFQYKFIVKHNFSESLFLGEMGASFNLKALLYVGRNVEDRNNWTNIVFNNSYDNRIFLDDIMRLLLHKSKEFQNDLENFHKNFATDYNEILLTTKHFLEYRLKYVKYLLSKLC